MMEQPSIGGILGLMSLPEKRFRDGSNLVNRTGFISLLLNNKNYICDTCDKRFTMKSQLDIHQKTVHENLKAFKCDSCEKTFGQIGHLKRHFRVAHEKLRPHSCEHCGKSFGAKWNLNFH